MATASPPTIQTTEREQLLTEAAAIAELQRRHEEFPLYYYEPLPKLRAFHASSAVVRLLSGANRSGKTEHLVAEAAAAAVGYRPWILRENGIEPPAHPWIRPENIPEAALFLSGAGIRIQIPSQIFLVTGLAAKRGIAETLHPKVQKLLGPFIAKVYFSHQGIPTEVRLKNGSKIIYGSATQRGLAFESTNCSHYGIDEPIPRRVYTGIRRGAIDQFARIDLSFTPLGEHAGWLFRDLYSRADDKSVAAFTVSIYDNHYLDPAAIEEFARDPTISDVEKEARLHGRFLHLVDRIYPQFDDVHVIDNIQPDPTWIVGLSVDPHSVRPWAMGWFTITPAGDLVWFREWPPEEFRTLRRDERTIDDYAVLIRQIEGDRPADLRFGDPNYMRRKDTLRGQYVPSIVDIFTKYGLIFQTQIPDDLHYGESRVRALLAYDRDQPITQVNRPRMYVCEGCRNIIDSLLYYTARTSSDDVFARHESQREESFKDFADVVRYPVAAGVMDNALTDSWLTSTFGEGSYSYEQDVIGSPYGEPV